MIKDFTVSGDPATSDMQIYGETFGAGDLYRDAYRSGLDGKAMVQTVPSGDTDFTLALQARLYPSGTTPPPWQELESFDQDDFADGIVRLIALSGQAQYRFVLTHNATPTQSVRVLIG